MTTIKYLISTIYHKNMVDFITLCFIVEVTFTTFHDLLKN